MRVLFEDEGMKEDEIVYDEQVLRLVGNGTERDVITETTLREVLTLRLLKLKDINLN